MVAEKKLIITIAGRPGSGKSTTAKGVANQLGYKHFSSGDLFRAASIKQGLDVLELNLAAEKEEGVSEIDQLVDQRLRDIGEAEQEIVIDSRMAWHWMPGSFKVFLDLDLLTAASRILRQMTDERMQAEHIPSSPEEYAKTLQERLDSESRRYKKIYDVDPYQIANYDLVVDTATNGPEAAINIVVSEFKKWLKDES
jgi:cytidylate kinase